MGRLIFLLAVVYVSLPASAKEIRVVQANKTFIEGLSDEEVSGLQGEPEKIKAKKIDTLQAKLGDKVTFANRDIATHNINATVGSETFFDFGLQPPGSANDHSVVMNKTGEFEIRCAIHPKMKLRITVD